MIAENEMMLRFSHSRKRKPYYKPQLKLEAARNWGLFYPDSLKHPDIPHILGGGAAYDTVIVTPDSACIQRDESGIEHAVRLTDSACRITSARYPMIFIPAYDDNRRIDNAGELTEAVKSHLRIFGNHVGNYSLKVMVSDSFTTSCDRLASVIAGFCASGGTMITFIPEGDRK